MGNVSHAIARVLYEICINAQFPLHIWAVSMMYFHAFEEYTSEMDSETEDGEPTMGFKKEPSTTASVDQLMLGVTCMFLSVKANENYLNSASVPQMTSSRLSCVLDWAARVVLSYSDKSGHVSSEKLTRVKRRIKEFVPSVELTIMRIVGNSLVLDTAFSESNAEFSESQVAIFVEIYSSPVCLNHSAPDIFAFVNGLDCPQRAHSAISAAIDRYFIQF